MQVKAYIKGYNKTDFFANRLHIEHGTIEEVGRNYIIAKGTFDPNNPYDARYSSGWLDIYLTRPLSLKGAYTFSFDITLLETAENKETITFAVQRPSKFGRYTLPNVAEVKHHLVRTLVYPDAVETPTITFSLNGLRVKIENIMYVEGEEEKPYDNGRIRVKPVLVAMNPKNLFDKSDIALNVREFDQCSERYLSEDKNIIIAKGNDTVHTAMYAWSKGWVKPCRDVVVDGTGGAVAVTGDKLTISADITLLEYGGFSDMILLHLFNTDAGGITGHVYADSRKISATKTRYSWTFTITKDGAYYPVFCINSNRVQIENILITKDGDTNYFTPQKCNIFIKE